MSFLFCPECGTRYAEEASPRVCGSCGAVHYFNPLPVAVLLVQNQLQSGLLVVERNEQAGPRLALPGGFIVQGERWQAGAARELKEETGFLVDPDKVFHVETVSTPDGSNILIFGTATVSGLGGGPTDGEVRSWRFVPWSELNAVASQFRFPLHTLAVRRYMQMRTRTRRKTDR